MTTNIMENLFANPALLWTLLALPIILALALFSNRRRKVMIARLGGSIPLQKGLLVSARLRRWKGLCTLAAIAFLAVACAGPQWGFDRSAQRRKGRDVVIVLDLSRSMNAEQPSRRELAVRALGDLANTFEEHGGNRVALVVFAARAQLLFPLTHDCEHLRQVLEQIRANDIAKLTVVEPMSGTRIGTALKLAVHACDPLRGNRPVVVLLSDGDDPADDNEWLEGVAAANEKQVRIHVVGIGDPVNAETIPFGRDILRFEGEPIRTKLNEPRLREIASRTDGVYLAAHSQPLALGTFVQHLLDADELREETPLENPLPVYQLRYAWFLLPAVLILMFTMLLNEGPAPKKSAVRTVPAHAKVRFSAVRARAVAAALIVSVILSISAADPPAAEALLRQGMDAFGQEDYESALRFFEQAETLTLDPGRVSFNKAAAHYRLGQYREAIECYRRTVKDDQAPPERLGRAYFDLGNSLLRHGEDNAPTLAEAVVAYRSCLQQTALPGSLRADARHNLELAQLLWLKAKENQPEVKPPPKQPSEEGKSKDEKDPTKRDIVYVPVDPTQGDRFEQKSGLKPSNKSKSLSGGIPQVLPDSEPIQVTREEDAIATLEREARRIADARRSQRNPSGPASLTTKDW